MTKTKVIWARVQESLKNRVLREMEERGESEAVIVREALREHFERKDSQIVPQPIAGPVSYSDNKKPKRK